MTVPDFRFVMKRDDGEVVSVECEGSSVFIGQKNAPGPDGLPVDEDLIFMSFDDLKEFHQLLGEALDGVE